MPKKIKRPPVSVILTVYNEGEFIEKCLQSLLKQTLKPLEILVVDDGSTDQTASVISQFPVRLYKRPHLGIVSQCNFLAKKARGEILVRVDGDMYFDKNYLAKIIDPIVKGKAIAAFTKEEYVANPKNIWSLCWSINSHLPPDKRIPTNMPNKAWTFRAILRKKYLQAGGYSELGYGEDRSIMVKLGAPLALVAPGAICYHYNPSNLKDVFYSSRFMGRGEWFLKKPLKSFLIFSPPNSIRRGIMGSLKLGKPHFLLFKLIFDFGITLGFIERLIFKVYKK